MRASTSPSIQVHVILRFTWFNMPTKATSSRQLAWTLKDSDLKTPRITYPCVSCPYVLMPFRHHRGPGGFVTDRHTSRFSCRLRQAIPTSIAASPLYHHVPPQYIYTLRCDGSRPPHAHRLAVTQWKHRIANTYHIKYEQGRYGIRANASGPKLCTQLLHCH